VLIVSDLPLQGGLQLSAQQMADAEAYVLREHGFRAGRWRVAFQSCDDALASTRLPDDTKCASNARAYGRTSDVVAVLGPLNSGCALAAIPELAQASDPLAIISALATYPGLTRAAAGTPPGELRKLYPGGHRNFLRVVAGDDTPIAALALLAKRRGAAPVFVLDDGDDEYGGLLATGFVHAARGLGLPIAGGASWNPAARSQRRMAARVARARPRAVFLGGTIDTGAPEMVRALRKRLGPRVLLLGTVGLTPLPSLLDRAGPAARGVLMPIGGAISTDELGRRGRDFARAFGRTIGGAAVEPSAVAAAQSMEVALDAVSRSDGTRASLLKALFATRIENGLIGPVSFDRHGDLRESAITVLRVEPGARDVPDFRDVVVDSVQRVPAGLVP
jgi:branched-chain amino acid transport system substrate-binding protein